MTYWGSCLCGNVRYAISGDIGDYGYCHCTSCRKASGSTHAADAPVLAVDFKLLTGSELIREYESSPGKFRAFCSNCGSPLYAYLASNRRLIDIRLGTLDTPLQHHPRAHTWVSDKASWEPIVDELPQFPTWAPKSVRVQKGSRLP